ncbi:MAG: UDP-N-acetylmuramate--L-alanine ligase [Flavobacteriaceae bacterium]
MKRLHFIAIGGSAMHNLALALATKGFTISGSDDAIFEPSKSRLKNAGLLPPAMGWFPEKITTALDGVILGMHAKKDNPELVAAQQLGVKIYSYPEYLFKQSQTKTRVVIAGSHGKTSITAMVLHVLNYHQIAVDFMVGAQLEGFQTMVHLTETNDFMLIEGDEYLSSPLDLKPKFLWYKPHLTLISGIAWDHINVFPTRKDYEDQFLSFIDSVVSGGTVIYNQEDPVLTRLILQSKNTIRKEGYQKHTAEISDGITYLHTDEGDLPLSIFGDHNLSNLSGAKWICQLMGVDQTDFYEAIGSFKGAAYRLEKMAQGQSAHLFKDFAHAPSKVSATVKAIDKQFKGFKTIGCLELHTYSSLDPAFLPNYKGTLDYLDEAIVFYDPEALKIKGRPSIAVDTIKAAFDRSDLKVFTVPADLHDYLLTKEYPQCILLMMSSGNYGGLDWSKLMALIAVS